MPLSPVSARAVTIPKAIIDPRPPKFEEPKCEIQVPPNLGRPPRITDLIIARAYDGLTQGEATEKVLSKLTSSLAPQNKNFVSETIGRTFQTFNAVMGNSFLAGSPNNVFLKSLGNQQISLVGNMQWESSSYKVVNPQDGSTTYYARDWTGNYAKIDPPKFVVMEARLRLDPPGLIMSYPTWRHDALSGEFTTITEL